MSVVRGTNTKVTGATEATRVAVISLLVLGMSAAPSFAIEPVKGVLGLSGEETRSGPQEAFRFTELEGTMVSSLGGHEFGKISDLVVTRGGQVVYVILAHGGTLGIGERLTPVPWPALARRSLENDFTLNVEKDIFAKAPQFDRYNWPDFTSAGLNDRILNHFKSGIGGQASFTGEGVASQGPHGITKLIKREVENDGRQVLGKVEDVIIQKNGVASYLVLSPGSALGKKDGLIPIPWSVANARPQGDRVLASLDRDTLKNAPVFAKDKWPDFASQGWNEKMHGYYESAGEAVGDPGARMKETEKKMKETGSELREEGKGRMERELPPGAAREY